MNAPDAEWHLDTVRLGRRVLLYHQLDSTNNRVAQLAEQGEPEGLAVLADEQTAGRGQHGRSWVAPPRSGVLLSLLLRPPPALTRPAILTAWAAVGVCALVRALTGENARIKWPNDVLLGGRKVCGILIEQVHTGSQAATVVGIGLNVMPRVADLHAAGLPHATGLADWLAEPPETHAVAERLLRQLDGDYDTLLRGSRDFLEDGWREGLGLLGQNVRAECSEATLRGRLVRLHLEGVELEGPTGRRVLPPEAVRHLESEAESE